MPVFLLFFAVWVILNGKVTAEICIFGVLISAALFYFMCRYMEYSLKKELLLFRLVPLFIRYFGVLVKEIVKANVQTMKVILSPKAAYRPAVVRLQVPLEEASSRVLLSNSITLTPGTVTIRQQEEEFLVLCLDKDGGEAIPDWNLVRILKKLEGSK